VAVRQVAAVAPRRAVEAAPLVVPAPQPLARANRRVSSLMMMRYRLMRMSLCRSGCGNSPAPGRWCSMRRSRLTRRPQRRQWLPRPQELSGAHRAPTRRRQRLGPRGLRLQVAPPHQPNVPTGVFGNLGLSNFLSPFSLFLCGFILLLPFLPRSCLSGATTATDMATADAAVGAAPGPAPVSAPRTFRSDTSRGPPVDVFTLMVDAPGPSAPEPPGGSPSTFSH
jgi:hypothetical protein